MKKVAPKRGKGFFGNLLRAIPVVGPALGGLFGLAKRTKAISKGAEALGFKRVAAAARSVGLGKGKGKGKGKGGARGCARVGRIRLAVVRPGRILL